jgi:CheY-like chemotaxis protein
MLRQTLQKVLLLVSSQVRGGYVILNAVQDPASHSDPTMLHALFEISWTAFLPERWLADNQATGENMRLIFNAPINPALSQNSPVSEAGILDIADELETVRYIVAKMDGHINEWLFNNEFRSMQISVPLPRMGFNQFFAVDEYGIYMPKEYSTQPGHQESGGSVYSDIGSTVFTDDAYSHTVDLFGIDTISIAPADYNEEASADADAPTRDMGLDILLVDDNLNNRMLFSLFLSGAMHRITEAHNGREGVEAFQNASYDVIFMDMEMPMMDGYQATRIIRALEADNGVPSTPIVGMTAHALPEFRRQCMISGCSDFLYKPFTKSALTSMLDAFIQLKLDARRRTS